MTFDVWAALAEIEASNDSADGPEPNPVQPRDKALRICNQELIVQTVQFGASRHGAIATGANLGTTVTYRLIDKLVVDMYGLSGHFH